MESKYVYPFTAIVGQEEMKLALILNVINPSIGGVLIKGEKGTAKSTAVRSLAELLPPLKINRDCIYNCLADDEKHYCQECREKMALGKMESILKGRKVVELPVSATEDRVVGTLDLEQALQAGKKKFEPGILAQANNNILYIDEINLLEDHVVDVLLDAAAMGVNTVEREGVSYTHPAAFTLVGTMNPEEGEIRPQLLDRFGLAVEVKGERDASKRIEVIQRRMAYEGDKDGFIKKYHGEQIKLKEDITEAIAILPEVKISEDILLKVAELCIALELDGHRGDLTLVRTAQTLAAWKGKREVSLEDVYFSSKMALAHRLRRRPFEDIQFDDELVKDILGIV